MADFGGEFGERGSEVVDFCCESCQGAGFVAVVAVFFDDRAEFGVAVEGGAAEASGGCDGGERDGLSGGGELFADRFDVVSGGGHRACAMRVSRRVRRLRCRSASVIHPRCSASAASASVSMRCAARTAMEAASVRKLGQCSQMLA